MSLKKYLISMSICLLLILTCVGSWFVPVVSSATTSTELKFGFANGNLKSYVQQVSATSNENVKEILNNFLNGPIVCISYESDTFYTFYALNCDNGFTIIQNTGYVNYSSNSAGIFVNLSVNKFTDYVSLSYNSSVSDGLLVYSNKASLGGYTSYQYWYYDGTCLPDAPKDNSLLGQLGQWLLDGVSDGCSWIDDILKSGVSSVANGAESWANKMSGLSNTFGNYLKDRFGSLDATSDDYKNIINDLTNGTKNSTLWGQLDNRTIQEIDNTYSNLVRDYHQNIIIKDNSDGTVSITPNIPNNYYDYDFYTMSSDDYFNTYILYQYDTNNDDVVSWLKKIYNAIIDLPGKIKTTVNTNVTNTYNYLFVPSADDIQDLFADCDIINYDDDGNITYNNSLLSCAVEIINSVMSADDIYNNSSHMGITTVSSDDGVTSSNAPYWTMDFSFLNGSGLGNIVNDDTKTHKVIDFSILDNYIGIIRTIIVSFSYLIFVWGIIKEYSHKDDVLS